MLLMKTGNFALTRNVSFIVDSPAYWLWYLIPVLILASVIIVYRKQLKARSNVALMRTRRANKVAQKRLRTAKEFMKKHDSNGFFNEVLKAVWGYLSDKLNIPGSELNKENIASNLAEYGADQQLVDDIMRLLDERLGIGTKYSGDNGNRCDYYTINHLFLLLMFSIRSITSQARS